MSTLVLLTRVGLQGVSRLSKVHLSDAVFRYHITLSRERERRGLVAFSACPIVKTHRTFAYLDDRVVQSIVKGFGVSPSRGADDFAVALGVDRASWTAANKRARNERRRAQRLGKGVRGGRFADKQLSGRLDTYVCRDRWVSVCVTLSKPVAPRGPTLEAKPVSKKASYEERLAAFVGSTEVERISTVSVTIQDVSHCPKQRRRM